MGILLEYLTIAIQEVDSNIMTINSDIDKGLAAVDNNVPSAHLAWCYWQIAQNVQQNHDNAIKKDFWQMVNAMDNSRWHTCLQGLALTCNGQAAVIYLMGINMFKWASEFFPGRRWSHYMSNVAKQLNDVFRADHHQPTIELLEAVWNCCIVLRSSRLCKEQSWEVPLADNVAQHTPYTQKLATESIKECLVKCSSASKPVGS